MKYGTLAGNNKYNRCPNLDYLIQGSEKFYKISTGGEIIKNTKSKNEITRIVYNDCFSSHQASE
jgi:hypothetical protein